MRNTSQGEPRTPPTPRPELVEVVGNTCPRSLSNKAPPFTENSPPRQSVSAQCYNCHTTAIPLWRRDDKGKTVYNAYISLFYSILYVTYDSQYHLAAVSIISCMDLHILYL